MSPLKTLQRRVGRRLVLIMIYLAYNAIILSLCRLRLTICSMSCRARPLGSPWDDSHARTSGRRNCRIFFLGDKASPVPRQLSPSPPWTWLSHWTDYRRVSADGDASSRHEILVHNLLHPLSSFRILSGWARNRGNIHTLRGIISTHTPTTIWSTITLVS